FRLDADAGLAPGRTPLRGRARFPHSGGDMRLGAAALSGVAIFQARNLTGERWILRNRVVGRSGQRLDPLALNSRKTEIRRTARKASSISPRPAKSAAASSGSA